MALTVEEIHHFRHCGYLKLGDCLSLEMVAHLKQTILGDITDAVEPVVRNRTGRVVRLSHVLDRDPLFRSAAMHPPPTIRPQQMPPNKPNTTKPN